MHVLDLFWRRAGIILSVSAMVAAMAACGGSMNEPGTHTPGGGITNIPAPPNGVAQFSVMPTSIAPGYTLTALGSLNPPGHVLPTDHVYFYDWDLAGGQPGGTDAREVFMPATGVVIGILSGSNGESKVSFRVTDSFYFYFDHVVLTPPLVVGQVVQVGTKIGATLPGQTMDWGAFDSAAVHPGFVNRARYPFQTLYYVAPWQYLTPELQAQVGPHLYRTPAAADRYGRIDLGVAGRLAGDWFLPGMPPDSSWEPYGWTRTLSFADDYYDPSQVRISIGGTIGPAGVWAIDSAAPRPETVSTASGVVPYVLYSQFDKRFPPYGLLLVQMPNDTTITVELFVGEQTTSRHFDAGATTFIR